MVLCYHCIRLSKIYDTNDFNATPAYQKFLNYIKLPGTTSGYGICSKCSVSTSPMFVTLDICVNCTESTQI